MFDREPKFKRGDWVRCKLTNRIGKISRLYNMGMGQYEYAVWFPGGGALKKDYSEHTLEPVGPLERLAAAGDS